MCWITSNLLTGNQNQISLIFLTDIIEILFKILQEDERNVQFFF